MSEKTVFALFAHLQPALVVTGELPLHSAVAVVPRHLFIHRLDDSNDAPGADNRNAEDAPSPEGGFLVDGAVEAGVVLGVVDVDLLAARGDVAGNALRGEDVEALGVLRLEHGQVLAVVAQDQDGDSLGVHEAVGDGHYYFEDSFGVLQCENVKWEWEWEWEWECE